MVISIVMRKREIADRARWPTASHPEGTWYRKTYELSDGLT